MKNGLSREKSITCVYIIGYGRSGSTLLDAILGNHPKIFGAGELTNLFTETLEDRSCSCGQNLQSCKFWHQVFGLIEPSLVNNENYKGYAQLTKEIENLSFTPKGGNTRKEYRTLWENTLEAISTVSSRDMIVDSSKISRKEWYRPFLFAKECTFGVKFIHLVRDPRAVMWSSSRGSNKRLEAGESAKFFDGALRGLFGWIFSNIAVELLRPKIVNSELLLVRYEDLVTDPIATLETIGNFLNVDVESFIEHVESKFESGHGVSGNRMRRLGILQFKNDNEWQRKLPSYARVIALLAWPLARRYGYEWSMER